MHLHLEGLSANVLQHGLNPLNCNQSFNCCFQVSAFRRTQNLCRIAWKNAMLSHSQLAAPANQYANGLASGANDASTKPVR